METKRKNINNLIGYLGLLCFVIAALASSSAENAYKSSGWEGSYGQQTMQHVAQKNQGGKYVGNYSSYEEARQAAVNAGYSKYQYYPSTGECFGYK
ncbi:MAG: hypothetical protein K2L14_05045 [Duncaniella sp.]|nr:hypothetical protein [Duncaniella sp.]